MRAALLLLATAACTEPVVEMELVMPKDGAMIRPESSSTIMM